MSTEKTQLPDFVIADLYTDLLVLGSDIVTQTKIPSATVENILKTPEIKIPTTEPTNTTKNIMPIRRLIGWFSKKKSMEMIRTHVWLV